MWKAPVEITPLTASSEAAAAGTAKKGAILYVSPDCQDFTWKKVAITASLVGEPLQSIKLSAEDFATLAPHARSCVLAPKGGGSAQVVAGPNACCRYLAGLREDLGVLGASDYDGALVEQYVEFSWKQLEVVLGAVTLPPHPGEPPSDKAKIAALAAKDVASALATLNTALIHGTFLARANVPSLPTLADAACVAVVAEVVLAMPSLLQGGNLGKGMPHLCRWFLTCAHHPAVAAVLGDAPAKAFLKLLGKDARAPAPVPAPKGAKGGSKGGGKKDGDGGKAGGDTSGTGTGIGLSAAAAAAAAASKDIPALQLRFKRTRTRIVDVVALGGGTPKKKAAEAQAQVKPGDVVTVKGWARTVRAANKGQLLFIVLNDGSCAADLQCVVEAASCEGFDSAVPAKSGGTGAAFSVTGKVVPSKGGNQAVELQATSVTLEGAVYGGAEAGGLSVGGAKYPLSKKGHSMEFMREKAHLRPRTRAYASTQRLRSAMAFATHTFFHARGFQYVHTPLITGSDCEGAGEMFQVTTLLPTDPKGDLPRTKAGEVDYGKDFFGKPTGLTVSGQLNVETHACALSDVYTFGPTFRAEDSHTSRHLAEFWMIEPEMAFAGLTEDMDLAEDYLKSCVHHALDECMDDLLVLQQVDGWDARLVERLKNILEKPFTRLTYTEAIAILQKEVAAKKVTFEEDVSWGIDMGSEHERYLAEKLYCGPVIVTNYPAGIKAFYMKLDEGTAPGRATVQAMDILVPRIGEIIGGSVREDDYAVLLRRAEESGLVEADLSWYLDLRKYGSNPHAGFGLGFERLVMLVTGVENIRDTIPFPRYPGHCEF